MVGATGIDLEGLGVPFDSDQCDQNVTESSPTYVLRRVNLLDHHAYTDLSW